MRVENLLVIESAELRLAQGLNVVTGETGAGKSVLAHALDLLLGARPRGAIVRPGAAEAYVEGVFSLDDELGKSSADRLAPDAEDLVLARRVGSDGRTRALIGGRSATVGELRELAGRLIAFHGQHEHRRLLDGAEQLTIVDDFIGSEQAERLADLAGVHGRLRAVEAELRELAAGESGRATQLELLDFQIAELERAAPDAAEARELAAARDRLRSLDVLRQAAAGASQALEGSDDIPGAGQAAALAAAALASGAADPALAALSSRAERLADELRELSSDVGRAAGALDDGATVDRGPLAGSPLSLEVLELRLGELERLERRHDAGVEALAGVLDGLRERREELSGAGTSTARLEGERDELHKRYSLLADELSVQRRQAAPRLATAVEERLEELAMPGARFVVAIEDGSEGARGRDAVELQLAANPGVPAAPISSAASGGELSRVMLAILAVSEPASWHRRRSSTRSTPESAGARRARWARCFASSRSRDR